MLSEISKLLWFTYILDFSSIFEITVSGLHASYLQPRAMHFLGKQELSFAFLIGRFLLPREQIVCYIL